ncbi:unnamed protein product, partial [Discosporangium mesarthrocarpum]
PNVDEVEAKAKMDLYERKLLTTSMKLVEEKAMLRQKEKLKAKLKELHEYNLGRKDIRNMQDARRELENARREKNVQVAEIRDGLRRLKLACRLGVPVQDLVSQVAEIPKEAIGR